MIYQVILNRLKLILMDFTQTTTYDMQSGLQLIVKQWKK